MASNRKSFSFVPFIVLVFCLCATAIPTLVSSHCPNLPNPTSFPGDTSFNNTIRSQMWINNGVWWAAFSDDSSGIYFYKLVGDTFVKGDLIDENFLAGKPDTIWTGSRLFILMYQSGSLAKLYKYSYVSSATTYTLREGFPIDLPLSGGVTDIAFDQDSTGKLWATYTDSLDGKLRVIWSTSSEHKKWNTNGKILATGLAVDTEEAAGIVRFKAKGQKKIGVVWSNQALGRIRFLYHLDGNEEHKWSQKETVDCCQGIPGVADNHLSLRALPDGRLFLIAKDDLGLEGRLHLYIRRPVSGGVWGDKTILDPDPNAAPTRPTLQLDLENDDAYVIYRDTNKGGRIYFVRTSLEGTPAFTQPCVFINRDTNSPVSTKQAVNGKTDLVAAVSGDGQIFSNIIDLESTQGRMAEAELTPPPEDRLESFQVHRAARSSTRVPVEEVPVANFGFIWDSVLSWSDTPMDEAQWRWLHAQGVNTVVTLDDQKADYGKFGLDNFLWLPLDIGAPPTDIAATRFLRFIQALDTQPIINIHAAEGRDRIATLVALIRYAIDGQPMDAALAEAHLLNEGQALSPAQEEWLVSWSVNYGPGSHRHRR
jgi:hypothetical protein